MIGEIPIDLSLHLKLIDTEDYVHGKIILANLSRYYLATFLVKVSPVRCFELFILRKLAKNYLNRLQFQH